MMKTNDIKVLESLFQMIIPRKKGKGSASH